MVLEEVLLSRELEAEVRARAIVVGAAEIAAERALLATTLTGVAEVPPDEAERLLQSVRVSRGLGELRFAGLLKRNAQLRALVRQQAGGQGIVVPPEDVDQAILLRYGPRVRARLILVRTEAQAAQVLDRIEAGEPFGEVAARLSADASRMRGGLLDPISEADPAYPVAFRRALELTSPGQTSKAIMVPWDNAPGFAIVKVEERIAGTEVDRAAVAPILEAEVRMVRERATMDRLARDMIDAAAKRLSVMDSSLEWSWRTRRGVP